MEQEEKKKAGDGSERECLRCGSLIPLEDDEGLCPTCGTEYGRATIAMPALEKPLDFGVDDAPGEYRRPAHQVDLTGPAIAVRQSKGNGLLWAVAIIFALLALGIVAIAAVLLIAQSGAPPEPVTPPPLDAPAAPEAAEPAEKPLPPQDEEPPAEPTPSETEDSEEEPAAADSEDPTEEPAVADEEKPEPTAADEEPEKAPADDATPPTEPEPPPDEPTPPDKAE